MTDIESKLLGYDEDGKLVVNKNQALEVYMMTEELWYFNGMMLRDIIKNTNY